MAVKKKSSSSKPKKSVIHKHVPTKIGFIILALAVLIMAIALIVTYNQNQVLKSQACSGNGCGGYCYQVQECTGYFRANGKEYCDHYKTVEKCVTYK